MATDIIHQGSQSDDDDDEASEPMSDDNNDPNMGGGVAAEGEPDSCSDSADSAAIEQILEEEILGAGLQQEGIGGVRDDASHDDHVAAPQAHPAAPCDDLGLHQVALAPVPAPPAQLVFRPHLDRFGRSGVPADVALEVQGYGILRYYSTKRQFVAQCTSRGHSRCFLTKTAEKSDVPSRQGQGRPLAFMLAWLCDFRGDSREEHVHTYRPTLAAREGHRTAAIQLAPEVPEVSALLARERPKADGEGDEPEYVP